MNNVYIKPALQEFHGSYLPGDCTFILDPIAVRANAAGVPEVEEGALQAPDSPAYSVQIGSEAPMSDEYMRFFFDALSRNAARLAYDVAQVARVLAARPNEEIVLASLVRAGTPIGVLMHRALDLLGKKNVHYSISATRKRGSDPCALDIILDKHNPEDVVFLDGWTGKGYIAGELKEAMHGYCTTRGVQVDPSLIVLADLAGVSSVACSADDYLIPAAMLRSTVCGLISASMLNPKPEAGLPDTCLFYEHLLGVDCSRIFVDTVSRELAKVIPELQGTPLVDWNDDARRQAREVSDKFVDEIMARYDMTDRNKVKPGICEANRALLTRATEMVFIVRDRVGDGPDLANLFYLCEAKGVQVIEDSELPYRAAVLLK
jgi:hypothetical protein